MFNDLFEGLRMISAMYDYDPVKSYNIQRRAVRVLDDRNRFNDFINYPDPVSVANTVHVDKVGDTVGELLKEHLACFNFINKFIVTVKGTTLNVDFIFNDRLSDSYVPVFLEYITDRINEDIVDVVNMFYNKVVIDSVRVGGIAADKGEDCKAVVDDTVDTADIDIVDYNVRRLQKQVSLLKQQLCELREAVIKPAGKEPPATEKESSATEKEPDIK